MKKICLDPRTLLIVVFLSASPTVAMAYIDPGNGAYMVQALFTLVGAGLFYLRHPIRMFQAIVRKLTGRPAESSLGGDAEAKRPDV